MTLELHPLCTLFPRLDGAEFAALRDDIAANGLQQPIVLHEGRILDGGNRYRACLEAGVEPIFDPFPGGNPVAFVLSRNLHRRHMTPGQQAAIVATAQNWGEAQPAHRPTQKECNVAPLSTVADRAAQSGASVRTQKMADKVAKADPELARQVAQGEVSLPKAVEQVKAQEQTPAAPTPTQDSTPARPPRAAASDQGAELRERNAELEDMLAAYAERNAELEAENKTLKMAADPDVLRRVEEVQQYARTVEQSRDHYMTENAQLKKEIKKLQRALDRREKGQA